MRLIPHIFISLLSLALTCYSDEVIHDAAEQASAEISERELGAFQRPKDGQDKNFADKRGEGVLAKITKMASFEKWKTFEDNYVKFSYPDHEAITLEVKTNEPIAVDGDRVSDVDVSYSRAYRLVVSGTTLTALMLSDAVWLDDGMRIHWYAGPRRKRCRRT